MVQVRLLGPIDALLDDGSIVEIGAQQRRRVLLALALDPSRVVGEDALVDVLWQDPETLPGNPRNTLQQYVSHLRRDLGGEVIETVAAGYRLGEGVGTDVAEFEARLATARAHLGRGDDTAARQVLGDALALWRGPVFGGQGDIESARGEAVRLEELWIAARELGLDVAVAGDRLEEAMATAEALTAEFPLREAPVRALAMARHRSGQQAEALRAIAKFRSVLAEQTGLEVSKELAELEHDLLEGRNASAKPSTRHVAGYELGELVGEGAFGAIYRATQPSVGREVAIKVVKPELSNDPEFVRRFEVEAQTVARLEHPHIVPLYDFWRDPSGAFLVMHYLTGGSAAARLVQQGPWPLGDVVQLVEEIGPALAVAHNSGVVHRDVKPENILFDDTGNSYLADFGIAADAGTNTELELRSAGSPLYASPEQVRDGQSSVLSDVYAFGVVLFELLTGTAPFGDSSSIEALMERKLLERIPAVAAQRPDVPSSIDLVIQTATDPDPTRRFPSMSEFVLAFRAAGADVLSGAATTDSAPTTHVRPREAAGQTLVSIALEGTNPFKGLAAFGEADAGDFFGREQLVRELADKVQDSRFVIVTGPSGSGKSSVVRAGLVPEVRDNGLFVASIIPGAHPLDELETALLRVATEPPGSLLEQLSADERGLSRSIKRILPDDDSELVLLVDQFEELFTQTSEDRRDQFLAALAYAATEERSRLRVVATLRADFYDRPLQHRAISELVRVNTVAVTPLSGEELDAAITRPAGRVGVSLEPALVAELVGEVRGHPGALPMLQFALTETYERRDGSRMTLAAYRGIGGITGALANRADEIYTELDKSSQHHARRLFTRLITPGEGTEDTRRRVLLSELATIDAQAIDTFGAARLLTFDHDPATREPTVEVAHEALIREWPRLRGWLDDDRDGLRLHRHLGVSAEAWETSGRDEGELYRGGRLEAAEAWAKEHGEDLNEAESAFLEASIEQRRQEEAAEQARFERQAATNRRLRALLAGVGVLLVVALVAGAVALQQQSRADTNAREAELQSVLAADRAVEAQEQADLARENEAEAVGARSAAQIGRLAADAAALVQNNRVAALLLAAEAYQHEQTPTTLGALQQVLSNTGPFMGLVGAGTPTTYVSWTDDGDLIGIGPSSISLYDMPSAQPSFSTDVGVAHREYYHFDSQLSRLPVAASSSSGSVVAYVSADDDTRLVVLSIPSGDTNVAPAHSAPIEGVAMSEAGERVATIDSVGNVRVVDADTLATIWEFAAHPETSVLEQVVEDDVVAPNYGILPNFDDWPPASTYFLDKDLLVTVRVLDVRVWDLRTRSLVNDTGFAIPIGGFDRRGVGAFSSIAATGDGALLFGYESRVGRHDLATNDRAAGPNVPGTGLVAGTPKVVAVAGGPEPGYVWFLVNDGRVMRQHLESGEITDNYRSRLSDPSALALHPETSTIAAGGADGIVLFSTNGRQLLALAGHRSVAENPWISPDGSVVVGSNGNLVSPAPYFRVTDTALLQLDTPTWLQPWDQPEYTSGGPHPYVIQYAQGATIRLHDPDTLEPTVVLDFEDNWSAQAASPDGKWMTIGIVGEVALFDTATGEKVASHPTPGRRAFSAGFSANSSQLITTFNTGAPLVFSVPDLEPISTPLDDVDLIGARWTEDGKWLVTVDPRQRISLRDPSTNEPVHLLEGSRLPDHLSNLPAYSIGDGRYFLSAVNNAPQLWDATTGEAVGAPFPNDEGLGMDGADGLDMVVTGVGDHFLVWNLDTSTWLGIACQAAGRNLTPEEWQRWGPEDEDYQVICQQWPSLE